MGFNMFIFHKLRKSILVLFLQINFFIIRIWIGENPAYVSIGDKVYVLLSYCNNFVV